MSTATSTAPPRNADPAGAAGRSTGLLIDPSPVTGTPAGAGTVPVAQAVAVGGAFGAVVLLAGLGRVANRTTELAHAAGLLLRGAARTA